MFKNSNKKFFFQFHETLKSWIIVCRLLAESQSQANDGQEVLDEEDGAEVDLRVHDGEPLLHRGGAPGQTSKPRDERSSS